jgi:hypothetical protein
MPQDINKVATSAIPDPHVNMTTGKMLSFGMAFLKDNTIYGIATIRQADTIIIQNRNFVPLGENFCEVLLNAPITLFIQHESRLIAPGQEVGYGSTSKVSNVDTYSHLSTQSGVYSLEIPPDFEIRYLPVFWVRKDGDMHSFIGRNQFLKIFQEKKKQITTFIKDHSIKMADPSDVKELVEFCNRLYNN